MFRELELTYGGKQYRLKPTMDLIRSLEMTGINLFDVAAKVHTQQQCFALYAGFLAHILQRAGATVTDEQIYAELSKPGATVELYKTVAACVLVLLPPSPVPVDAPTVTAGAEVGKRKPARRSASGSQRQ